MTFTTYDPATGDLKEVRTGISFEALLEIVGDAPFIEGAYSPEFYKIDLLTGQVVEKLDVV